MGENHGANVNGYIQKEILKILITSNKKIHILVEAPYSTRNAIQQFILGNDSLRFMRLCSAVKDSSEQFSLVFQIRNMIINRKINKDSIDVFPIDIEQNFHVSFIRLQELLQDKNINGLNELKVVKFIQKMKFPSELNVLTLEQEKLYKNIFKSLLSSFEEMNQEFKKKLGNDSIEFEILMRNLKAGFDNPYRPNRKLHLVQEREKSISKIIYSYYLEQGNEDLYLILLGSHHTNLEIFKYPFTIRKIKSVAYLINNEFKSTYNKVLSIVILYPNQVDASALFFSESTYKELCNSSDEKLFMIKLNGDNTPFEEFARKFQYVFVNRGM